MRAKDSSAMLIADAKSQLLQDASTKECTMVRLFPKSQRAQSAEPASRAR